MLKAGALLYAIFISIIISILCGIIILSYYYNNRSIDNSIHKNRLLTNINSAINLILIDRNIVNYNNHLSFQLYDEPNSEVFINRIVWGAFEIIKTKTKWSIFHSEKVVQIGEDVISYEPLALYLVDNNNYLSVCGKTILKGTCYIPNATVKRAFIEGQFFIGTKLIDGEIKKSENYLPEINPNFLDYCSTIQNDSIQQQDSILMYSTFFASKDSLFHSFLDSIPILLYSPNKINIQSKNIKGYIIIKSDEAIEIESDAKLSDIILIAPFIKVKEGFEGNIQLIGSDSITIEKNVKLLYPSLVAVITEKNSKLNIRNNVVISGAVLNFSYALADNFSSMLTINKDAIINGLVYTNCNAEIQATINGSLYCNKISLKTNSGRYENHLLNAEINFNNLSEYYVGTVLLKNNHKCKIVKCLY